MTRADYIIFISLSFKQLIGAECRVENRQVELFHHDVAGDGPSIPYRNSRVTKSIGAVNGVELSFTFYGRSKKSQQHTHHG